MLAKGEVFNNIGFCAFCTGEEKNLLMEELALRGSFFFGVITEVAASTLFFLAATVEDCFFGTGTEAFCTGTVAVFLTAFGPTDCVCVVFCCIVCSFFSCFFDLGSILILPILCCVSASDESVPGTELFIFLKVLTASDIKNIGKTIRANIAINVFKSKPEDS